MSPVSQYTSSYNDANATFNYGVVIDEYATTMVMVPHRFREGVSRLFVCLGGLVR